MINKNLMGACLMLLSVNAWSAGFNDNGDGTVTDFATGLIWQQSDAHNSSTRSQAQALAYCADLNLAGNNNWRLPEVKELASIVDFRRVDPSIDMAYFPDTINYRYWSASIRADYNPKFWYVRFDTGGVGNTNDYDTYHVRCVR